MKKVIFSTILIASPFIALAADSKWIAEKHVDPMTDDRYCDVRNTGGYEAPSVIALVMHDHVSFSVGAGVYPGTDAQVRIDSNKAITGKNLFGEDAEMLLNQLQTGNVIKTRFYSWPGHEERIGIGPVGDLHTLIDQCMQFIHGAADQP